MLIKPIRNTQLSLSLDPAGSRNSMLHIAIIVDAHKVQCLQKLPHFRQKKLPQFPPILEKSPPHTSPGDKLRFYELEFDMAV